MPIPKQMDDDIRKEFDDLIGIGQSLVSSTEKARDAEADYRRRSGIMYLGSDYVAPDRVKFGEWETRIKILARRILEPSEYQRVLDDIQISKEKLNVATVEDILGILAGLKTAYESGSLDDLAERIEAIVAFDFMGQAEQLLEGEGSDYDHIPAAVLVGAVLENGLRRLCERQSPPIETKRANGTHKRLNSLIDELQGKVFKPAKADLLRSWAKTRNSAAHGQIDQVKRGEVEDMIDGIKKILAEHDL